MAQFAFEWPARPSYADEDFILSPANVDAARFLECWPQAGASYAALLCGPAASGKTHLAHRWGSRTHPQRIAGEAVGKAASEALWGVARYAVLEDIHAIRDEEALFHLLRYGETEQRFLLLSSRVPAVQLDVSLLDLRSRLLALPAVFILPPDEELLRGFLMKCFADRQWRVNDDVATYIACRIERSFAAAHQMVEAIERKVAESKKEITIPLVKSLML